VDPKPYPPWWWLMAPWTRRVTLFESLVGRPRVSGPGLDATVYQAVTKPGGKVGLERLIAVGGPVPAGAEWAAWGLSNIATYCMGQGTFLCPPVFGVDPNNPLHLIAADLDAGAMRVSTDGGNSWPIDSALTYQVTAGGTLLFAQPNYQQIGGWNLQPHVIAFDPADGLRIFVGTEAAGIIVSTDGGASWRTLPRSSEVTAVSGFFFDEVHNVVYVSTYGRGLWKIEGSVVTAVAPPGRAIASAPGRQVFAPSTLESQARPAQNNGPYLQLVGTVRVTGETLAYPGDTIMAYGSGFCGGQGCSPVLLSIGDQVVAQGVQVAADGTFVAALPIAQNTLAGRYVVKAYQDTPNNQALVDQQAFGVPIGDSAENEAGAPRVHLPMITR
jgi:hypothetical protein